LERRGLLDTLYIEEKNELIVAFPHEGNKVAVKETEKNYNGFARFCTYDLTAMKKFETHLVTGAH